MNSKTIVMIAIVSLYFAVVSPSFAQTSQPAKSTTPPAVVDSVKTVKMDKKLDKIQAKADAKIEKIKAKADAKMEHVQAKADSAKAKKEMKDGKKGLMGMKAKAMVGRMAPADSAAAAVKPK
ncbi:MAG: hypothetical protein FJY97_11545 [candidate division Zixibacteria bacterium]|nr:hypothetical protein [candidate division Zixibacteria bacterium]